MKVTFKKNEQHGRNLGGYSQITVQVETSPTAALLSEGCGWWVETADVTTNVSSLDSCES